MKGYATFFLTAVMALGLIFLLATRSRTPHEAPLRDPVSVPLIEAGSEDGGAVDAGATDAVAYDAASDASPASSAQASLRVVTLGWELAAAGAALAATDGGTRSIALELAPEPTLDALEARLARGGSDSMGADVAILPLPAFVIAYERLRALDPRAFLLVGFSRGREEIHATAGALLKAPPGGDEVKLVASGFAGSDDASRKNASSESATMLGLFALDLLGVAPVRVRLVAPGASEKDAPFAAVVRGTADERKLAFSSADASRFLPIVAIAPKALLDSRAPVMRDFSRAWLEGLELVGRDASTIARRMANKDSLPLAPGVGGAPEAIALLERLGQFAPAGLAEQRHLVTSRRRSDEPLSLEWLMQRQWALARGAGLTTMNAPSPLPMDDRTASAIASEAPAVEAVGGAVFSSLPVGSTPLVMYRADGGADAATVVAQIGYLSGIFERAAFRITAKGGEKAARAIATTARETFALPSSRLATRPGEPTGAFAIVEVVALP